MKHTLLLCLCAVMAGFSSCEGYSCAAGVVLDANTGLPIDSVHIELLSNGPDEYTDSTGTFEACNSMGGCVPHCKDIVVKLSMAGYKSVILTEPRDSLFYLIPL